jgi:hypothetical protein
MGVMVPILSPGVQHHQHADRRAQPFGVGGDFAQRSGGTAHEQVVEDGRVGKGEFAELRRQGESGLSQFLRGSSREIYAGFQRLDYLLNVGFRS